jgi:hypothetical protein
MKKPSRLPVPAAGLRRAVNAVGLLAASLAALAGMAGPAPAQSTHLVVVSGLSGEPQYADLFHQWSTALIGAARERHRVPAANIIYLAERPERDPSAITGQATRANIEQALRDVANRASPGDAVFIVLFGHGGYDGRDSRFNVVGPNVTAREMAAMLDVLSAQRVAIVNTTSASGGFIEPLSGAGRAIVTATRDGRQNNATIFPQHFVHAFVEDVADSDRDNRVSLLEAYIYARQEVAREFQSSSRLQTEHSLLDDNGDRKGTAEPDPRADPTGDGVLARTLYLGGASAVAAEGASPQLQALYRERQRLESALDALRGSRATTDPERYEIELERLLLELARTSQQIRDMEGSSR